MRYRKYHTPAQTRRRRRLGKGLILLSLLAMLTVYLIETNLFPLIESYAANRAKIFATNLVNEAVAQILQKDGVTYDSLVRHETLSDGKVTTVEADAVAIDRLKTDVISKVKELSGERNESLRIPLGTLTNMRLFIGLGPNISIKLRFSPYVTSDITSEFQSAGINQTLHQMMLKVTTEVYMLMPGSQSSVQVATDYCLAETILVGEVPDAYTNVTGGSLANNIADYGAAAQSGQ